VSIQWSVSFHCHNRIGDNEVNRTVRKRRGYFPEFLSNEECFLASILRSWYNTEHVFHAERDAGPVMRLHFRHGDDEVGLEHRPGNQRCFMPV